VGHALRLRPLQRRDFARMLRAADSRDTVQAAALLPSFDRPARVVWAADDKFFPREHGRRLAELLARGSFELVENSRTFIPEDNPEALVESLRRFL
jgi:pimeloyl-ACP methyl ester carboxylesterase